MYPFNRHERNVSMMNRDTVTYYFSICIKVSLMGIVCTLLSLLFTTPFPFCAHMRWKFPCVPTEVNSRHVLIEMCLKLHTHFMTAVIGTSARAYQHCNIII